MKFLEKSADRKYCGMVPRWSSLFKACGIPYGYYFDSIILSDCTEQGKAYPEARALSRHNPSTNFPISAFTLSGASVLALCPAPGSHTSGMPVLLCQALL